jgi:ATP-dependent Lon protease
MTDKNGCVKKEINNKNSDVLHLIDKKIEFFKDVIQKTIIHVQKNKIFDILGISDVSICIERLGELSKKIQEISDNKTNPEVIINSLQIINNELSSLLKNYGTDSLEDLLLVCFGNNNKITTNEKEQHKLELLKKYFHPTSYKVVNKKEENKKKSDDITDETANLTCYDVVQNYKQFHMKVYGIKIFLHSSVLKKSLIIFGIIDDIIVEFLNNKYVITIKSNVQENIPQEEIFQKPSFHTFIASLVLKDFLIYENEQDIYSKYIGYIAQNNALKQKPVSQTVKDFILDDMFNKRTTLIQLLIRSENYDNQYLAYLLYDLLSNDSNGNIDTQEQTILFDSFPWPIKQFFKQAMKKTIQYTNELSNFDINKVPLEQQICLLKAPDSVKEKAMMKLKEVKAKSEDTGSKARQYLDGLLKIPFNVYKREPILNMMETIRKQFKDMYKKYSMQNVFPEIPNKDKYTSIEILKYVKKIQGVNGTNDKCKQLEKIQNYLLTGDKKKLCDNISLINDLLTKNNTNNANNEKVEKIKHATLNKEQLKTEIQKYIQLCKKPENNGLLDETINTFILSCNMNQVLHNVDVKKDITTITTNMKQITDYMSNVKNILDKAVYGHEKAKRQIERVIGQWINGDLDSNSSHVLGFEGNPGIGKTTLAKGLSECLKDENGNGRPFALIALGGDSNASTLVGHSYTYVGSNYGSIVQILMDKKCMNPIILFDEVDKISKTENGKEITGILTHLLDSTQNSSFQDKYFSGIDLDLSKILFILSYNDVESIDKILLDRVHRIKFDSLSIEDKIVISNKHLLPELYKKNGLEDMIYFSDEVLKFIIDEYTLEPGVRKLKEKLFEIVGEINLEILKNADNDYELPIKITIDNIKNKYFKDKRITKTLQIHPENTVGVINCLWANALGVGGILSASAKLVPSLKFLDLKLTGLLDQMMQESFQISLTNAYNLLSDKEREKLNNLYDGQTKFGVHMHMGDGSINKSGTSAGIAITILLYSLLSNKKIKNDFAVTGEAADLNGNVGEIGALNIKIIYGIKSGVKNFIYPFDNQKDFNDFFEKYKDTSIVKGITFYPIKNISEALELIME